MLQSKKYLRTYRQIGEVGEYLTVKLGHIFSIRHTYIHT